MEKKENPKIISDMWPNAVTIARSDFKFKSLCDWNLNFAVGCAHACTFCYVGELVRKQKHSLAKFGVEDPDLEWGNYVFVREWDENLFLKSLKAAEETPLSELSLDGHRAVMPCTTTDAYQIIRDPDRVKRKQLQEKLDFVVRRSLELILTESTLNVRISTRGLSVKRDFDLFKKFGNRLMVGMSIPSLENKLVRKYEPNAPAPTRRLETLMEAKEAGLNTFLSIAPSFPECDEADLRATLEAAKELDPLTIFHEPINLRGQNVERMASRMEQMGESLDLRSFVTDKGWMNYAVDQLRMVERIANEIGVAHKLHLWPDKDLLNERFLQHVKNPAQFCKWLKSWHNRVSEWPQ